MSEGLLGAFWGALNEVSKCGKKEAVDTMSDSAVRTVQQYLLFLHRLDSLVQEKLALGVVHDRQGVHQAIPKDIFAQVNHMIHCTP